MNIIIPNPQLFYRRYFITVNTTTGLVEMAPGLVCSLVCSLGPPVWFAAWGPVAPGQMFAASSRSSCLQPVFAVRPRWHALQKAKTNKSAVKNTQKCVST